MFSFNWLILMAYKYMWVNERVANTSYLELINTQYIFKAFPHQ